MKKLDREALQRCVEIFCRAPPSCKGSKSAATLGKDAPYWPAMGVKWMRCSFPRGAVRRAGPMAVRWKVRRSKSS